jgi:hypothetical protein
VATAPESHYVLDGLLGNATDLPVFEHATDTHGATLANFALFDLVGKQLSPRIRDLGKITLYRTGHRADFLTRYPRAGALLTRRVRNANGVSASSVSTFRRTKDLDGLGVQGNGGTLDSPAQLGPAPRLPPGSGKSLRSGHRCTPGSARWPGAEIRRPHTTETVPGTCRAQVVRGPVTSG